MIAPSPRKDSAGPSPCPRCSVTLFGDGAKPGRLPFSPHEPLGDAAPRQLELLLLFSRLALLLVTKRQMPGTGSACKKKLASGVGTDEGLRLDSLSAYPENLDLLVRRITVVSSYWSRLRCTCFEHWRIDGLLLWSGDGGK